MADADSKLAARRRPACGCPTDRCAIPAVDPKRVALAGTQAAPAAAQFPLSDTFLLHSRPSATKVIYLDFNGHVTTNTSWNDASHITITTSAFSFEGDATFSNSELARIQAIWERVSECYSPFDVDVTTQAPTVADLLNTGGGDTRWGIRVAIGTSTPSPAPGAGGIAFIDAFGWNNGSGKDTPCFVFPLQLGPWDAKFVADAVVHEVGHTLGLNHDGRTSPAEGYYQGHGSGAIGWAPHMGVGYYRELVQWSKGEYLSANNTQDDLNIITTNNGFGHRPDDYANTQGTAPTIKGTTIAGVFNVDQQGIIEQRTDSDWFKITAGAGVLSLSAAGGAVNTMLDIQMSLYNSTGSLIVSNNPAADVTASINQNVAAGTYYVKIDGVGNGNPLATGYTDYGSLGQYHITGTYPVVSTIPTNVTAAYNTATKTLTLTGDAGANTVTVTLQSGRLTVAGVAPTKINNLTTAYTATVTGQVEVVCNLNDGDDALTMTGMLSNSMNINLGNGNDTLRLMYCNIHHVILNGGAGTDLYIPVTSVAKRKSITAVP